MLRANTQVQSVLSRLRVCERDPLNQRTPAASPAARSLPPAAAALGEMAEELLSALRDCATLRRGMNDLIWVVAAPTHASVRALFCRAAQLRWLSLRRVG